MELNDQTLVLRCITSIYTLVFLVWMFFNITKPAGLEKTIGFVYGIAMIMVLHLISLNYLFVFLWSFPLLLWVAQLAEDLFGWDSIITGTVMIIFGLAWLMITTMMLSTGEQFNVLSLGYVPFFTAGTFIVITDFLFER